MLEAQSTIKVVKMKPQMTLNIQITQKKKKKTIWYEQYDKIACLK